MPLQYLILAAAVVFGVVSADECYSNYLEGCLDDNKASLTECSASFSGFPRTVDYLQSYANLQLAKSYEYLLLATNFGSYVKNRPGFEKQFRALSDKSWENAINIIKHITKRGGTHDFRTTMPILDQNKKAETVFELNELGSLAMALDTEKTLSMSAHRLHEKISHANDKAHYDPEIAHYLEEKFIKDQAYTIRKLSGYTNDLKNLIRSNRELSSSTAPLAMYMFDEYLQSELALQL